MFDFLSWERSGREARWAPKYSPRQARLFACACCRRIWHLLAEERLQGAAAFARRTRNLFRARQRQGVAQSGRLDWVEADPSLSPSSGRRAVEAAERFAEGLCGREEVGEAAR